MKLLLLDRPIDKGILRKLTNVKKLDILPISSDSVLSYYKFPVLLDESVNTTLFKETFLTKYNIELESVYWPTCHLQPVYRNLFKYKEGDFPVAEKLLSQQITLPIHPLIEDKDIDYVVSGLREELCE